MRRLPFLTPLAGLSVLATLAVIGGLWWLTGGTIASPGRLSASRGDGAVRGGVASHAELEERCAACHPPPWSGEVTSDRCLACHDEVRAEIAHREGLHSKLGDARRCLGCHTDHRGRDARLTAIDRARFPHAATGFSLAAHPRMRDDRPFACGDCHEESVSTWEPGRCEACHRADQPDLMSAHVAAWGSDCRACHDGVDRFGAGFDHARTRLALEGAHAGLDCRRCHEGVRTAADFAAAPERCVGCHRDDDGHAGRFGDDCGRCHGAAAWKPASFDHAKTRFPLTGGHVRVACADCHAGGRYQGTPTSCVACHPMPADHAGTFGDGCAACHRTDTWKGARFEHRFPLDHGARGPSACETCHPEGYQTYTCYGCHEHTPARIESEHREEGISDLRDCARCHPTGREEEGERGEGSGRREGREEEDD